MSLSHPLRRNLSSAGLVIAWSGGFIGAELGTRAGADPFTVLSWRFLILSLILVLACTLTKTSLRGWAMWKRQLTIGSLSQVGYLGLVFLSVSLGVHGGTAALIAGLQPLIVTTLAGKLLGESITKKAVLGTTLGFTGVALVVSGDVGAGHGVGYLYILPTIAMLCLTAGTIYTKRTTGSEGLLQSITIQAVLCAVAFPLIAAATGELSIPTNGASWVAIFWLICVPSIAGYGLYVFVTREFGATVVSTLLYLTPPTTMLWAWLIFRDPITIAGVVGLIVSATGVVIVLQSRTRSSLAAR